jgi:hypothetical protein
LSASDCSTNLCANFLSPCTITSNGLEVEGASDALWIFQLLGEYKTLLEVRLRVTVVAAQKGEMARRGQRRYALG